MEEIGGRGLRGRLALFSALLAGILNGWLGTGGGMILVLSLSALYPAREREVLTLSTACVFSFSCVSILLYLFSGHMAGVDAAPIVLPAAAGGILGALFLGRTAPAYLRGLLAVLLLFSGIRLMM